MAKLINGVRVVTNKVRLSYAHIANPSKGMSGDDAKYSVSVIIDKKDTETIELIEKAMDQALKDGISKFGGKMPSKASLHMALRDGDERDDEAYQDAYFVNCNSKQQPQVVGPDRKPLDPEAIYSGCYAQVSINFYAYNVNGSKGIAAGLGNIMFVEDGEPLGGGHVSAASDFGEAEDDEFLD